MEEMENLKNRMRESEALCQQYEELSQMEALLKEYENREGKISSVSLEIKNNMLINFNIIFFSTPRYLKNFA